MKNPLPQPLPKECLKAAKICTLFQFFDLCEYHSLPSISFPTVQSFVDNSNNGLDGVIPRQVLENAKGFAIFTIVKAGFVFSARAGSGIVIAKLDGGSESEVGHALTVSV